MLNQVAEGVKKAPIEMLQRCQLVMLTSSSDTSQKASSGFGSESVGPNNGA